MIANTIIFLLTNFTLIFFLAGLSCALIKIYRHRINITKDYIAEALATNYLLWSIGISFIYNGFIQILFPATAASTIAGINNTVSLEIEIAGICIGIACLFAFNRNFTARLVIVIATAVFSWVCAALHFSLLSHGHAAGNTGFMFWSEIIQPFISLTILVMSKKYSPDDRPLQLFTYQQKTFIAIPIKK